MGGGGLATARLMRWLGAALAVGCCATTLPSQAQPQPVSDARVRELQSLRWGMFICWSFSTFSGREWTPGITDIALFSATGCDTDQWARTAKEAGMGYVLFLTKHHDGFCLWDTRTTERKVTRARLGRDVLSALVRSCRKYGIRLALYFSEGEWAWSDLPGGGRYGNGGGSNPEMKRAQLRELLTGYGPIEFIWFDFAVGEGGMSHADTSAFVKSIQPNCFVGYNGGPQDGADIRLGEMGRPGPLTDPAAAGLNAGTMSGRAAHRLAEFTYPIQPTHEGGAMWFYSLPRHDGLCLPAERLYADYLGAVRYGNLFSLDVGPDYAGRLRAIDVRTLRRVGSMIRRRAPLPAPPASRGKPATASSVWAASPAYGAGAANDGDPGTRWGAAEGSRTGWLMIDLGAPSRIGRAVIDEGDWGRVRRFALEAEIDGAWLPVATGTTIGPKRSLRFRPILARRFRLNVREATEVPTILEFELHAVP